MNKQLKHILLSTIITMPISAPMGYAMEQPIAPNDFQQKMDIAIQDYFKYQGKLKAQELGIVEKEEGVPLEEKNSQRPSIEEKKKRMQEVILRQQEETAKRIIEIRLNQMASFKPYWINQDPEFGNTIESVLQKINTRETVTGKGCTLLHMAVHYGEVGALYYFLDHGAMIVPTLEGLFPDQINMSPEADRYEYSRAQHKIKKRTNHGHHALKNYKWPEGFDILANPNVLEISSGDGYTPLHVATYYSDLEFVKYLLTNGAAVEKDKYGKYPHEMNTISQEHIPQNDHNECRRLVKEAYLKILIEEDSAVDVSRLQEFWTHSSTHFQSIKVKGDLNTINLYELLVLPTTLKNVDVTMCTGICPRVGSILALMMNQSNAMWIPGWPKDRHLITDLEARAIGKGLSMNTTTKTLGLQSQKIGDAVAIEIGKALHVNKTLEILYLNQNQIGDAGAIAIAQALPFNTTLKYLCLHSNAITDKGAIEIGKGLGSNTGISDMLHLYDNKIGDVGVAAIAAGLKTNSTLRELTLDKNPLSDASAEAILDTLQVNKALLRLRFDYKGLKEEWAPKISAALTRNVSHTARTLLDNAIGGTLRLSNTKIDSAAATLLGKALAFNTTVTELDVSNNQLGTELTLLIIKGLATNKTLKIINLDSNNMGDKGANELGKILAVNTTLTSVIVNSNGITDEGITALYKGLEINPDSALEYLGVSYNPFGDKGATEIARVMRSNTSIKNLSLVNSIGDAGATAIAEMLKVNRTIETACLHLRDTGDEGCIALAGALEVNTTLTNFSVHCHKISNNGGIMMANALIQNNTLKSLRVGSELIDDTAGIEFITALKINTTLTDLCLAYCKIGVIGKEKLRAMAIESKRTISV